MGVQEVWLDSGRKGQERQELRYELSVQACACGSNLVVLWLYASELGRSNEKWKMTWMNWLNLVSWERAHPLL